MWKHCSFSLLSVGNFFLPPTPPTHTHANKCRRLKWMVPYIFNSNFQENKLFRFLIVSCLFFQFVLLYFWQDSKLGEVVEPMVWVYVEDVDRFVDSLTWANYGEVFSHIWAASAYKGQLISERNLCVFKFSKMCTFFVRISTLASKMDYSRVRNKHTPRSWING